MALAYVSWLLLRVYSSISAVVSTEYNGLSYLPPFSAAEVLVLTTSAPSISSGDEQRSDMLVFTS